MFAVRAGWERGCLRLGHLRAWAGEAAGGWARRPGEARWCGSGGGGRRPGSESEPEQEGSLPGPARGARMEWALRVSPCGRLLARLPCHLAVKALDPLAYPDADRVLVAVSGVPCGARDLADLQVRYDEARREVTVLSDTIDPRASVEVNAPLKFDLNIKSSGSGCVKVQNIQCDNCKIETEQGSSILQSVKSQKLHVQTKGGKVICLGTIYGDIEIHASDKSTVTVDKLQGSSVNISTEDGLLKAKYLYTKSSFLSSAAGDITLGSVHGNITLQSKMGNITVGKLRSLRQTNNIFVPNCDDKTIDVYLVQPPSRALVSKLQLASHMLLFGPLNVALPQNTTCGHYLNKEYSSSGCMKASTHQGTLDVYVSQLGKVELKSHKGSVLVKVESSLQAHLQLSGKEVDVNSEVQIQEMSEAHKDDGIIITGIMNQGSKHENWIKADAPKGTISFKSQSWFQSLKLQD